MISFSHISCSSAFILSFWLDGIVPSFQDLIPVHWNGAEGKGIAKYGQECVFTGPPKPAPVSV
jgi:hypothetical protein